MRIACVGGGPAGLYFSILARKLDPTLEVVIHERNKPDDTFGWGVVFSDETLGNFETADAESLASIRKSFVHWTDMHVFYGGARTVSTGHGFSGLSRLRLLNILQARAQELGVTIHYESEISDPRKQLDADLVLVGDGVNSRVRTLYEKAFKPELDWRKCKFCWLGTDKVFDAFTFYFKENHHGQFQVHAYPFSATQSTFIVECREETWKKAGLDTASETETVAYVQALFGPELGAHKVLSNRSIWRTFPTIRNGNWVVDNMVIMGDAAHTAHFSIGSGTKLAMEDAMALKDALQTHRKAGVPAVLRAYEDVRKPEVERLQRAAQTSLEWFENSHRFMRMPPVQFTFGLMTRSKRITYDNLAMRDPALVEAARSHYAATAQQQPPPNVVPAFTPYKVGQLELQNRIVVSPMCQYSAQDGLISDWHLVHLGSRAVGGAGLIIAEDTAVSAQGRISLGCAGLYKPEHAVAWKRVTDFVHSNSGSRIGLQLGHAGRKASTHLPWEGEDPLSPSQGAWETVAPSPIPYAADWHTPRQMTRADMDTVLADFVASTRLAAEAGFDLLEVHMAHGYLLSTFLSPLSNTRQDAYGGDIQGRMKFPLEVMDAMRVAWPRQRPMSVRISATDWADGGLSPEDRLTLARALHQHGADIIDVSAGGVVSHQQPIYGRMFQVHLAEHIRLEANVPVMTVGNIQDVDQCNTILAAGRADLCVLARAHLADPYLTLHAAAHYGQAHVPWPKQYLAARPAMKKGARD